MIKISDEIRAKVNDFGQADLSVITVCHSEQQALRQAIDNLPIIQRAFEFSSNYGANTTHIENEALTEFRNTNFDFEKEDTIETLQDTFPDSQVHQDKSSSAYIIQLG